MRLRAGDWTGPACPPETADAPVQAGPPRGPRHGERTEARSGARPDRRVSGPRRLSAGKTWEVCLYVAQPWEIRSRQATGRWRVQSPGRGPLLTSVPKPSSNSSSRAHHPSTHRPRALGSPGRPTPSDLSFHSGFSTVSVPGGRGTGCLGLRDGEPGALV